MNDIIRARITAHNGSINKYMELNDFIECLGTDVVFLSSNNDSLEVNLVQFISAYDLFSLYNLKQCIYSFTTLSFGQFLSPIMIIHTNVCHDSCAFKLDIMYRGLWSKYTDTKS